jgi:hypothetical protein
LIVEPPPLTSAPRAKFPGVILAKFAVPEDVPFPKNWEASAAEHVTAKMLGEVADTPNVETVPAAFVWKIPHCVLDAANGPIERFDATPQTRVVPVALALHTINRVNGAVMIAPEPVRFTWSPPSNDSEGFPFCDDERNVGEIESEPVCVRSNPDADLSLTNFTGPLFVTVPTPLLVGPSVVVSARSYHAWSPAMLFGLNPVALGLNNLGLIGLMGVTLLW